MNDRRRKEQEAEALLFTKVLEAAREVVREKNVVVNTKVSLKSAIDALDGALAAMKPGRQAKAGKRGRGSIPPD